MPDGDQRAFVSAVQTDDSQENHGDEDGTRQKPNEPGGSHVSSTPQDRTGQGLERRYVDEEDGGWVKFRGLLLVLCPPGVSGPHEATTVTKYPP